MTYDQFVHAVEAKVKEGVKKEVSVQIRCALKNNGIKRQGLTLLEKGINISPTIYLEEYYRRFQNGDSVETIAEDLLKLYNEVRFCESWEGEFIREYSKIRERIVYRLINRKDNQELLSMVPYQEYLDLAIVFYVLVEVNSYGSASMMIQNEHLKLWETTTEEIYQCACANTRKLLPDEFNSMGSVLEELMGIEIEEEEEVIYLFTNRIRSYGAAVILYEGRLETIGEYLKENFFVLPSSIHEVLIVPESRISGISDLEKIVREVNQTQLEKEEILSDRAYYYDREKKRLL